MGSHLLFRNTPYTFGLDNANGKTAQPGKVFRTMPQAAAVIEDHETHTRRAEVTIDLAKVSGIETDDISPLKDTMVRVPVTQAVICGWYDNERGGYANMLVDLTVSAAEDM